MSILDERPPEDHTKFKVIPVVEIRSKEDITGAFKLKIPLDEKFAQFFKDLGEKLKFWKKR